MSYKQEKRHVIIQTQIIFVFAELRKMFETRYKTIIVFCGMIGWNEGLDGSSRFYLSKDFYNYEIFCSVVADISN